MYASVGVKFAQMISEMLIQILSHQQTVEATPSIQILNVVIVEFIVFRVRVCHFMSEKLQPSLINDSMNISKSLELLQFLNTQTPVALVNKRLTSLYSF